MSTLIVILLLGGIAYCVYTYFLARGGVDMIQTSRPAREIVQMAVTTLSGGTMSMRSSWMPTGHTETSASFVYQRRKSILVAIILFFFFIIPCILYLIFGGKNQTMQVSVFEGPQGVNTVQAASSGGIARRRARRFLDTLSSTRGVQSVPAERAQVSAPDPNSATPSPGYASER